MEKKTCLVCTAPIPEASSRLGIEACRACSSFFKRSIVAGKKFTCRQGEKNCPIVNGDKFTCRSCRFAKCLEFGMELQPRNRKPKAVVAPVCSAAPAIDDDAIEQPSTSSKSDPELHLPFERECVIRPNVFNQPKKEQTDILSPLPDAVLSVEPEHVHSSEPSSSNAKSQPILEQVRSSYRCMCDIRRISELLARPHPPHPMFMNEKDCPLEQATLDSMTMANRILLASIDSFGTAAFTEYSGISKNQQWMLAVNFFYRFRMFESSYRADKHFPEDPERLFGGYTIWFTHNYEDRFYKNCHNTANIEQVKTSMHTFCKDRHQRMRALMRRLRLKEAEFFYVISLMFWTTDCTDVRESVAFIADKKRTAIMQEIHTFYTEERRLDNYAARLGELLTAIQMFDNKELMQENAEFLRLMNVFSDDSFLYRLHREDSGNCT